MEPPPDIGSLLSAARNGRPEAIGQILEAARGHLLKLADRELPAELRAKVGPSDLVQETAVDVHRHFSQFTGTTAAECFAWLREILRNNVVDAVRRYSESLKRDVDREVTLDEGAFKDSDKLFAKASAPDGSAMRREEAAAINEILARLPPMYREVLQLRYWSGMSFVDMAPQLGRSPDAVRKLWYRAVALLRTELAAANGHSTDPPSDLPPQR
jgi:RNA polymerase sigma-70 factor, ECF subfamily